MCYRMRLTSILDARMKEMKQCLNECEQDFAADDPDGRRNRINTWFSENDYKEATHDAKR